MELRQHQDDTEMVQRWHWGDTETVLRWHRGDTEAVTEIVKLEALSSVTVEEGCPEE